MSRDNTYFLPIVSHRCGLVRLGCEVFAGRSALLPRFPGTPMRTREGGLRPWHTTILDGPEAAD